MLREKGISIREENPEDRRTIGRVIERAFRAEERSDHREHLLVERLRGSEAFVPRLSLVAECDGIVVGYALMSEVRIESDGNYEISLALAPVAVLPEFQRQGIGSALIREAHRRAADSGYRSAVVLGHKDYYPRFGYRKAADFGIAFPFGLPQECCMAVELLPGGLEGVSGTVRYPRPFME